MKKKQDVWYLNNTNKASGSSSGSRLVRILLVCGCLAAAATVLLSLFFYFFPVQAVRSARSMRSAVWQIIRTVKPPPLSPSEEAAVEKMVALTDAVALPGIRIEAKARAEAEAVDIVVRTTAIVKREAVEAVGGGDGALYNGEYWIMVDSAMGAMTYYNQGDSRWANYQYGGQDVMAAYGCGPTVVAMLINAFTDHAVNPKDMADWSVANGCYAPRNGSYHSIITKALSAYGLKVESAAADYETAVGILRSGRVLVALMGSGNFSREGHFIIITNVLENGNVRVADSYDYANTEVEWDLNFLLSELKKSNDGGGPLWAVGYPDS